MPPGILPGTTTDARIAKLGPASAGTAGADSRLGKAVLPTGETREGGPKVPRSVDDYVARFVGTSVY